MKLSSSQSHNWIVIAKITRPHGYPREGVFRYRATLSQRGSVALANVNEIGLAPLGFDPQSPEGIAKLKIKAAPFVTIPLYEAPSPLGGKWDLAEAVLLGFSNVNLPEGEILKDEKDWVGRWVALRREVFPSIPETEFYLCDLLGLEIRKKVQGSSMGVVQGFEQLGKSSHYNVQVKSVDGHDFEFPLKLIDWQQSNSENYLVVPSIDDWKNL